MQGQEDKLDNHRDSGRDIFKSPIAQASAFSPLSSYKSRGEKKREKKKEGQQREKGSFTKGPGREGSGCGPTGEALGRPLQWAAPRSNLLRCKCWKPVSN